MGYMLCKVLVLNDINQDFAHDHVIIKTQKNPWQDLKTFTCAKYKHLHFFC